VWPGRSYPLGATWNGEGVNFALFSEHAEKVELCLFSSDGRHEIARVPLHWHTDQVWHTYLPEARPGLLYGYRVHGPYRPEEGHRFNPHKLLLDPYARQIVGALQWSDAHFGYRVGHPKADLSFDRRDSAPGMPKCVVVDSAFTWGDDRPPRTPWHKTVIYELHVKGITQMHPGIPEPLRGSYAALATEPIIEHLRRLGVTAVELMPVHTFIDDRHLLEKGLRNYWGYNSIGFFAPDMRYALGSSAEEFKTMVRRLHSNNIEVILDVVYNHTAEGNQFGPTLSFRGIDNAAYYRLAADNQRYYVDYTGTGNTLNMRHPRVLQLIMDSLRYWVQEMHVDGFRFDLASALARELHEVNRLGAFFDIIHQDPILSQVKLIAEPWDLGEGGYQVGNFPVGWVEWNDRYRDDVRRFWRGDEGMVDDMAYRLTGSSDLYASSGRRPYASVNFVTAHDGFPLHDLVSYNEKHNEANLEENRDGNNNNLSWNCGAEGDTDDATILRLREQQKRNFLATLLLSQGVPMLLAGDEMGRTQCGNNNAYCQDSELSWVDWNLTPAQTDLLDFLERLMQLRRKHPVFHRRSFFQGQRVGTGEVKDVFWFGTDGKEMNEERWGANGHRSLGMFIAGDGLNEYDDRGRLIRDNNFLLLFNAGHEPAPFMLPTLKSDTTWIIEFDTARDETLERGSRHIAGECYDAGARSLVLLREDARRRGVPATENKRTDSTPCARETVD